MAVVAAGFFLIFRKKYGLGVSLTMIFTAMGFSPHPQMAYYMFMMIGVIYIAELYIHIKEKRYKDLAISTALFAVSVIVGVGTGTSNVFANSEYVKETMRGGHSDLVSDNGVDDPKGLSLDYVTAWSYGVDESLTFLIPGFMGNASGYNVGTDSEIYRQLTAKGVSRNDAKEFCKSVPACWNVAKSVFMEEIMSSGYEIAKEKDIRELFDLQLRAFESEAEMIGSRNVPALMESFEENRADFRNWTVLVKRNDEGRIIGAVRFREESDHIEIGRVMVAQEYRNRGVAIGLMTAVEELTQAKTFELYTCTKSYININLYEKLGYRIYKEEQGDRDLSFAYMRKTIG